MIRPTVPLLLACLACAQFPAHAQLYKWKDESGRTIVSDRPPPSPSVKVERASRADGVAPVAAAKAPDAAAKPGTDPELEKRRKAQEDREQAERDKQARAVEAQNREYCDETRKNLALLESGQRIATADAQGERTFLDDDQRAAEVSRLKARLTTCK